MDVEVDGSEIAWVDEHILEAGIEEPASVGDPHQEIDAQKRLAHVGVDAAVRKIDVRRDRRPRIQTTAPIEARQRGGTSWND